MARDSRRSHPATWAERHARRMEIVDKSSVVNIYHTILFLAALVALVLFW